MIVTTDIGNILYRDCKAFGISIVPNGETLTGELEEVFRRSESLCARFEQE